MKIKSNFAIRNISGNWVALPLGDAVVDFTGMITLNESGVMLWRMLEGGCTKEEMTEALINEYEVTYEEALSDINAFVKKLDEIGCIDF
jgi:hypothetical protein